jgi:hypothetical protein
VSDSGVVTCCEDGSDYIEKIYPGKAKEGVTTISAECICIFGLGDPVAKLLDVVI